VLDWTGYRDDTAQELRGLVEAKLHGQPAIAEPLPLVLPLLEALQQSVATTQPQQPSPAAAAKAARSPRKRAKRPA
jgi:non-homologous end joining protein Ku